MRESAALLNQLRQAEVGQMRFALGIEQHVARLDIAMQDAALMGVVNGPRQFDQQFRGLAA